MKATTIDTTRRVQIYYNLHRKCYSVRQGGKVVAHVSSMTLTDARFLVSEAGRQKVIASGVKGVHAVVTGFPSDVEDLPGRADRVSYNPFKGPTFVRVESGTPILRARVVRMSLGSKPVVLASE
jgi:hypothetical protein